MSNEDSKATNREDVEGESAGAQKKASGTSSEEGSSRTESPVEDINASPEGLKDAPALEEDEDSVVAPENS
ncbi:hypothetical protein ACX80O_02720 [Arthrobacter sp. Hz1]